MIYTFYNDKTYSKKKKKNKLIEFSLIDISTDRKGPVYTLVKNAREEIEPTISSLSIDISYAPKDLPFTRSSILTSEISINSLERFYNVNPLLSQIFTFNNFYETNGVMRENDLFISSIEMESKDVTIILDESCSDKAIYKTLKKLGMTTDVSKILNDNEVLIVTKNKEWDIISKDNLYKESFKYVYIPIPYCETLYRLSKAEYLLLEKMKYFVISLGYIAKSDDPLFDIVQEIEMADEFTFNNEMECIQSFLFIPQLILLHENIFHDKITLRLETKINRNEYILEKELNPLAKPIESSIFQLFKSLLKMKL